MSFYPLQGGSVRGFFLLVAPSNMVNYGQSQSTVVNQNKIRYVSLSIYHSISPHYGIDESTNNIYPHWQILVLAPFMNSLREQGNKSDQKIQVLASSTLKQFFFTIL